jgi:hypothetical protein
MVNTSSFENAPDDNQAATPEDSISALARSAQSDIFGKLDDELPAMRINGDVKDILTRQAREAGMNLTEFVRTKVYVGVFGIEHIVSLHADRYRRAMGNAETLPRSEVAK